MLRRTAPLLSLALALVALATAASPALARTIEVTTTADDAAAGVSLRAALATAASGDVVHVPAGRYVLDGERLSVPSGVTVAGDGARGTTVSGDDASGVFTTAGVGVVLQDLTIADGRATSGAGVDSSFGLTLHRVAVLDNVADIRGGGVSVFGPQPLLIDHSLIARNRSGNGGGGVLLLTSSSENAIVSSTIARNVTLNGGGGIDVNPGQSLVLRDDTLSGNAAVPLPLGASGAGNLFVAASTVFMGNTVLAGGEGHGLSGNCRVITGGSVVSLGHNAQDTDSMPDPACQNALDADPTNRARLVLKLGALADNGGPTDTLLPGAGSPLLDTGDGAQCAGTDQRGVPLPQGGGCDVGAVERTTPAVGAASVDAITSTSATLHAGADTVGLGGSARFAFGLTSGYGMFAGLPGLPAVAGVQGASAQLTGLAPATTYHFQLLVTSPDGAAAGGDRTFTTAAAASSPPPGGLRCVVPKLTGRTLAGARRSLARAHCKLGTVKRPRVRRGARRVALVVRRQSRRAGSRLAGGTRVGVTLGPKPMRRR